MKKNTIFVDKQYKLVRATPPLSLILASRHTQRFPLLWFDEETGEQKEIRYSTNQNSPLVDEQKGECTMGHIRFDKGMLEVDKSQQNLQKLLSLYHPLRDKAYQEYLSLIHI